MPLIAGEARNTNVVARVTLVVVEAVDAEGLGMSGFESLEFLSKCTYTIILL